ncbi:MAG: NAD-dependent protein deacylase, partial [Eubacteriales bacterium]
VDDAVSAIASADTMLIIGTSLVVYPAASFVRCFRGKHLVLINKTETPYDHMAELAVYDDIVHVVHMLNSLQNGS